MIILVNRFDDQLRIVYQKCLGQTSSTVGEEKHFNSRLTKSREEFIRFMKELKLSYPAQIGTCIRYFLLILIQLF